MAQTTANMSDKVFGIGRVKFYDDNVNNFGRICDDARHKEYNFAEYINVNTRLVIPKAGDIVEFFLLPPKNGRERAINVSRLLNVSSDDYEIIVKSAFTLFEEVDRNLFGVKLGEYILQKAETQTIVEDTIFKEFVALLNLYTSCGYSPETIEDTILRLNIENRYKLFQWSMQKGRVDLSRMFSYEVLCEFVDYGYDYKTLLTNYFGYSSMGDRNPVILYALKQGKIEFSDCLHMFANNTLHQSDELYGAIADEIKRKLTPDELFVEAKGGAKRLLQLIDKTYFLERSNTTTDLGYIHDEYDFNTKEKFKLLQSVEDTTEEKFAYLSHNSFLSEEEFAEYKRQACLNLQPLQQIDLWISGHITNPFNIEALIWHINQSGKQLHYLALIIERGLLDRKERTYFLENVVKELPLTKATIEWCYENQQYIEDLSTINQTFRDIFMVINWVRSEELDNFSEQYLQYFQYLPSDCQVTFLRKYIELYRLKLVVITPNKLKQLIQHKADVDINVYLVIYSLCKFRTNGQFISNKEMYEALRVMYPRRGDINLSLAKLDSATLLDTCRGQYGLFKCWEKRVDEANSIVIIDNQYNTKIKIQDNFKAVVGVLKDAVPASERSYNNECHIWQCTNRAYQEVLEFAKITDSVLEFAEHMGDKHYEFTVNKWVDKVKFCEGKPFADKRILGTAYWCLGNSCLMCNRTRHTSYEHYTLYDFMHILNLHHQCDDIDRELMYFYSNLNWFSRCISHLYCRHCGMILEPVGKDVYNAHTITRYECAHQSCKEYGKEIYINHCFMPRCNSVVDSRDSKQCEHGYVICNSCGVCCGREMYGNKIESGLHVTQKINELHFDRKEFFCAKCAAPLIKTSSDTYKCEHCNDYAIKLKRLNTGEIISEVVKSDK